MLSALESIIANPKNGITTAFNEASSPDMNPVSLARGIMDFYPSTINIILSKGENIVSNDDKIH